MKTKERAAVSNHIAQYRMYMQKGVFIDDFTIIRRCRDDFEARTQEALLIKKQNTTNSFPKTADIRIVHAENIPLTNACEWRISNFSLEIFVDCRSNFHFVVALLVFNVFQNTFLCC